MTLSDRRRTTSVATALRRLSVKRLEDVESALGLGERRDRSFRPAVVAPEPVSGRREGGRIGGPLFSAVGALESNPTLSHTGAST